jgi:hypothetical protein
MKSDLELLVEYDMYINGFDASNPEDVLRYWKERLNEQCDNLH